MLLIAGIWLAGIGAAVLFALILLLAGVARRDLLPGLLIGGATALGISLGITALLVVTKVPLSG